MKIDPLSAAAEALAIVAQYGFQVRDWRFDQSRLRITIAESEMSNSFQQVATALENDPRFANVVARPDSAGAIVVEADVRVLGGSARQTAFLEPGR
jgi:hypothetical protein